MRYDQLYLPRYPYRFMSQFFLHTPFKAVITTSLVTVLLVGCGSGTSPGSDGSSPSILKGQIALSANVGADHTTAVQQLYVAYFGRPADTGGLANFSRALLDAGAPTDIQGLNAAYGTNGMVRSLVDAFGTSAESNALYTGDTSSFVSAIYRNVLNRAPEARGLAFWVDAIDHRGLTKGNAALSIMAGALANTTAQGRIDAAVVNNKIAVAKTFTAALDTEAKRMGYSGDTAAAAARDVLTKVSDQTEPTAYTPLVNASIATLTPTIASYVAGDITAKLSMIGVWAPVETANTATIEFWNVARLGPEQLQGVVLAGWAYSGFNNTAKDVTQVRAAVLAQQVDGTLKLATDEYLPLPETNGAGSVIVADFNGDSKDDIFLAAHNESPFVAKPSTVYLSKPDGKFNKVTLSDSVMAHHASLAYINGKPTVFGTSFNHEMANPIYTYNGNGGFEVNNTSGFVSAMSVVAADFLGNGGTQIIYGDALWGFDLQYEATNVMAQYAYGYVNGKLVAPKTALPAPYFNDKPQYTQYKSQYGVSKTHNSRLWADDLNQDGKPDVIVGAEIWESNAGLQKSALQLLVNQGNLVFSDRTDVLNPGYNQSAYYDYSIRIADLDNSGINSIIGAQQSQSDLVNGQYLPRKERHGNYIFVNDGTGRLHIAMHDEFIRMGDYVNRYVASQLGSGAYYIDADGNVPRFIPFQTATGDINFVAVVPISEKLNDKWVSKFALVNVPLSLHLSSQYKANITVADRNGSRRIRTFAGDDVIHQANDGGTCTIDGGFGLNTVIYSGKRTDYTITKTSTGHVVKDNVGKGGADTLIRIQQLKFADEVIML